MEKKVYVVKEVDFIDGYHGICWAVVAIFKEKACAIEYLRSLGAYTPDLGREEWWVDATEVNPPRRFEIEEWEVL